MTIAVPTETAPGEKRVALTPDGAKELIAKGARVRVQSGAGAASFFRDQAYLDAGAEIAVSAHELLGEAELVAKVLGPSDGRSLGELDALKSGATYVGFLFPASNPEVVERLCERNITSLAMDLMPRISRAQSMDALSSMSTIAGYRAALLCATHLPRFFPMFMTAAGTLPPARVFVIGAGVAGLQAIATCRRLGAVVEAFDVRQAVQEQIESLGGKFVGISLVSEEAEDTSGYAKEVSVDTHARELDLIASRLPSVDCVISTALVPGRAAPILITEAMLKTMRPGSVIVDLAAPNGGNCEATVPGETVVKNDVTVIGRTDLLASMAADASRMYSKNLTAFLSILIQDGRLAMDLTDEIVRGTLVTHEGKVVHDVTRLALKRGGVT